MKQLKNNPSNLLVIILVGLVLTAFSLAALAQPEPAEEILDEAPSRDEYSDSNAVYMLDKGVVEVTKDNEKSITTSVRVKVFNKEGRQSFGEVKIPYVAGTGEPELNYVRTITPEGDVIEPDEDDIRDITPARLSDYPMYSDVKNKVISMPGLTNGAIIDYSYTLSPERFFLKDDFASNWLFRTKQPVINSHYEVSFPADMEVSWTDFGADLPPSVEEEDGRKTLSWKRNDLPKISKEPAMPPIQRVSERVLVSSIDSWDYYANEFWELAKGRAEPNEAIKQKVNELTEGLETEEEKIHAIYNYVATKIRYVAIELGRGKIQPHEASEVFQNKYGDCKDKATLMISMLDVAGIDAYNVLILSGLNAETDFEQPPPGKGLNHAIVAVETDEGLELMDPTCDVCPYDYLPYTDRGKKALAIVPGDNGVKKLVETERFNPDSSVINAHQQIQIGEEGNLEADIELNHSGYNSYSLKNFLESYTKNRREQVYKGVLSQLEPGARLEKFEVSDLQDVDQRLNIDLSYKKSSFADSLGDSLVFQTPTTLKIPLNRNYDKTISLSVKERKYPVQLAPTTYDLTAEISVPEGSEVVTPEGVSIDTEWASYESSYETKDGMIVLNRKFVKKKPLVPLEGYAEFKEVVNRMSEDRNKKFQVK
ncbi:DUF3857 and transglutaminase domain-containing protein [Candidatus Bipolaricaulota bacterium]|nr:DUF3857 and transglutaminase domain-containing protein [Candidatus Bipolaricaulota bacterium]